MVRTVRLKEHVVSTMLAIHQTVCCAICMVAFSSPAKSQKKSNAQTVALKERAVFKVFVTILPLLNVLSQTVIFTQGKLAKQ